MKAKSKKSIQDDAHQSPQKPSFSYNKQSPDLFIPTPPPAPPSSLSYFSPPQAIPSDYRILHRKLVTSVEKDGSRVNQTFRRVVPMEKTGVELGEDQ